MFTMKILLFFCTNDATGTDDDVAIRGQRKTTYFYWKRMGKRLTAMVDIT